MSQTRFVSGFAVAVAMSIGLASCQQPAPPAPEKGPSAADEAAEVAAANEATAKRLMEEVLANGNLALVDELLAPDFVEHQPFPPDVPQGVEGLKWFVENFREAFPDLTITINRSVASGDLVAIHSTWNGTHQGAWMGMEPTGQPIEFETFDMIRFEDGKIAEHWGMDNSEQVLSAESASN